VLRTATTVPAEAIGAGADLGSIEPGKLADLVLIDGNPLENIKDLRRVKRVMKDGQVFELDALLRRPATAVARLTPSRYASARLTPSRYRATPSRYRATPSRYRATPSRYRATPSRYTRGARDTREIVPSAKASQRSVKASQRSAKALAERK
jgi:imidazolonepropionase-like amidohydrolase